MKIVEPQVELWKQEPTLEGAWHQIARATRVCYQSKPREGESDEAFVNRVILKPATREDGSIDFDKCHGAMLEHGTIYLTIPKAYFVAHTVYYICNKYSKVLLGALFYDDSNDYVTTNIRVILENNLQDDLKFISAPTHHIKRTTFSVITDIGVTRELNRHRVNSIAEQSTRYCTYSADKFGNEITYTNTSPFLECVSDDKSYFHKLCEDIANNCYKSTWDAKHYYAFGLLAAEFAYLGLKKNKVPNDRARQVLNLNTRSQAIYTAFDDDWEHFIKLRADDISGKVHPNMKIIADKIKELFNNK
jgi:thymidylate synthase (FAD)